MRRGTTPIVSITVDGQNFDGFTVIATIDQNGTQISKSSSDSDEILITKNYDDEGALVSSTVAVYLSQADTLAFEVGAARIQLRWINGYDEAYESDISTISFEEVLLEREIVYGE